MSNFSCALNLFTSLRRAVVLAVFALAAAPLSAQTAPAAPAPAAASPSSVLAVFYEHDFSANLKSGASGKLNENIFGIGGQSQLDWSDNHWTSSGAYIFNNNNFSGTAGPLFHNVVQLGVTDKFTHDFSPDWSGFAYVSLGLSAETEASLLDGGQAAIALGPTYNASKDLSISFGPMYYTRMQDTNTWIPMADLKWAFLPQWELRAYAGVSNGVTVSYDVFNNQATVVDASVEYNSTWFRVRNSPAGAAQAVNESNTTLKIGVRQALSKNIFVRGFVSAIFDREYQFHTSGHAANSFNVDATLGLGLEAGLAF